MKISVIITTLNEEKNISRCLDSVLDIADEIIVIDSFSTDNTENICRSYGVRFIKRAWEGYSRAKNYGNSIAKNDMILSMDADECLSDELVQNIKRITNEDVIYSFHRVTYFCGELIKHGGLNDRKPRIFNRRKAEWVGDFVHEQLNPFHKSTQVFPLEGIMFHHAYENLEYFLFKMNKYSTLHALSEKNKGNKRSLPFALWRASFRFFKEYFLQAGFLDGQFGFVIAYYSFYYNFTKYVKTFVAKEEFETVGIDNYKERAA